VAVKLRKEESDRILGVLKGLYLGAIRNFVFVIPGSCFPTSQGTLRMKFFKKALAARSLPIPLPRQNKNTNYAASGRSSAMQRLYYKLLYPPEGKAGRR
jgi:hypothetical protein